MNAQDLLTLAELSGYTAEINLDQTKNEYVCCTSAGYCVYKPKENDEQCFRLLKKLTMIDDWELFADDELDEYYIYQWQEEGELDKRILAYGQNLNEVVLYAAQDYLGRQK